MLGQQVLTGRPATLPSERPAGRSFAEDGRASLHSSAKRAIVDVGVQLSQPVLTLRPGRCQS